VKKDTKEGRASGSLDNHITTWTHPSGPRPEDTCTCASKRKRVKHKQLRHCKLKEEKGGSHIVNDARAGGEKKEIPSDYVSNT
jgi:hypothetical protein